MTKDNADRYKFRTPPLRQIATTGPWGHDGAYDDLETMVRHHLNPPKFLENYDTNQAALPSRKDLDAIDFLNHNNSKARQSLLDANELSVISLSDEEIDDLMAFLYGLTDFECVNLRHDIPLSVPSGL